MKLRNVLIAALAMLMAPGMVSVAPAQVPVWDPEEIARMAEKTAEMAEALSRAVELLARIDDLSRTIGRFGALSNLDFARFDVVEGLQGAGPEIGGLASNIAGLKHAKIRSFDDASAIVQKLLSVPKGGQTATGMARVGATVKAMNEVAAEDGYALATHTRTSLAEAPMRAEVLVAQASATSDLRGDTAANTAAALAVLEQLSSVKAMLASILEMKAAQGLGKSVPLSGGIQ